jgi:hypothetical protein
MAAVDEKLAANAPLEGDEEMLGEGTWTERFNEWVRTELVWYAGSFTLHLLALSILLLFGSYATHLADEDGVQFDAVKNEEKTPEVKRFEDKFEIGKPEDNLEPSKELNVDPNAEPMARAEQEAVFYDNSDHFEMAGGGVPTASAETAQFGGAGGFEVIGTHSGGPKIYGSGGGIGAGLGTGTNWGSGGSGFGFGGRGSGHREYMAATQGGTKDSERAVAAALRWLCNHQNQDGSWSLDKYTQHCKDGTCTGHGSAHGADTGATAMGLLPFLAAGQTHTGYGPYAGNIGKALNWLIAHQGKNGDLMGGSTMYCHGLATIALCEAYGLTQDRKLLVPTQMAVKFILDAQNQGTGGWRYRPGDDGDTSVVGWQIMALKSAQMAGLINHSGGGPEVKAFEGGSKWLDSVAYGDYNSRYYYRPHDQPSNTMTSVGLLCRQYLGMKKDDQMMVAGMKYLMGSEQPDLGQHNMYYWYYATQVVHNVGGPDWDAWNRKMRRLLLENQNREASQCANGSWDPDKPVKDRWGGQGGRVMMTSLGCLTLEIYYRFLPLYKLDKENDAPVAGGNKPADAAKPAQPADEPPPLDVGNAL